MEYFSELGYIGLFIAAFLAATILPLSSEIVLSALLLGGLSPTTLVIIATTGNVLGSLTNYALGYWASLVVVKKWLRMSEDDFVRAEQRFIKYGIFSLCFAWVPIIGDPLTVMAGVLRVRLQVWFLIFGFGKLLRVNCGGKSGFQPTGGRAGRISPWVDPGTRARLKRADAPAFTGSMGQNSERLRVAFGSADNEVNG